MPLLILCLSGTGVSAKSPEIFCWLISDTEDFAEYETAGYGETLLLTKDMYGKYVKFVYTDTDANTSESEPRGPITFADNTYLLSFDDCAGVTVGVRDENHFVNCINGRLYAKNTNASGSDSAWITLPHKVSGAEILELSIGAESEHSRMKLFFCGADKSTVFTIYVIQRDGKLVLCDTTHSMLSRDLIQTAIGEQMRVSLRFDFENSVLNISNCYDGEELGTEIKLPAEGSEISYIKVCNEYNECAAWLDELVIKGREKQTAGLFGEMSRDATVTATLQSFSQQSMSIRLYAAFYLEGRLTDLQERKILLDTAASAEFKTEEEYDNFKLFAWDLRQTALPVSLSYSWN